MAVRSQLHAVRQAACNVLKELRRTPGVPPSNQPRNDQLGLCFDCRKRPSVTAERAFHFLHRDVLLLAPDEAPNLVDLNPLSLDIANHGVLERGACRPDFLQYPKDGTLGNPSQTRRGANGAPFNQGRDYRDFLVHTELVHESSMAERSGRSREKRKEKRILFRSICLTPVICYPHGYKGEGRCGRNCGGYNYRLAIRIETVCHLVLGWLDAGAFYIRNLRGLLGLVVD